MSAAARQIMAQIEEQQRAQSAQRTATWERYRAALLSAAMGEDTAARVVELLAELGEPAERVSGDLAKAERYVRDLGQAEQVEDLEQAQVAAQAAAEEARAHYQREHAALLAALKASEQQARDAQRSAERARAARQRVEQAHHTGSAFARVSFARRRASEARSRAWLLRHCTDETASGADARGHLFGYRVRPAVELGKARAALEQVAELSQRFPDHPKLREARARVERAEEHVALCADLEAREAEAEDLERQAEALDQEARALWAELAAAVPESLLG